MISLTKRFYFSAAHKMSNPNLSPEENERIFGLCQNIHGHNYFLDVNVRGEMDEKTQCIIDLNILKKIVKEKVIDLVDHKHLNDILPTPKDMSEFPVTLENLGLWIWGVLDEELKSKNMSLSNIHVGESETTSVTISRKKNEQG